MAEEEPQFYRQFFRSLTEDGQEIVREVVSPSLLDLEQARAAEAQAGRTFQGFVAPGDVPGLGAQPQAPPPPPPPPAPSVAAQVRDVLLPPERSFVSQTPSIVAGALGGMGGAALGAMTGPVAPVAVPALAIAGAGLASGGMEAGQAAIEQARGEPPSEPGTPWERAQRAAARGAAGEVVGLPLRALPYVARGAAPVLRAAEELAPVLEQAPPAAGAAVSPLAAWWQNVAPRGPAAVAAAWDALGPAGRTALAGGQQEAMQTVVNTLRASGTALPWTQLGARSATLYGLGRMLGFPELGEVAATIPAAVSFTRAAAPRVAAPMLLSPTGSQWLAALPRYAEVAGPWASDLLRGGGQTGAALVWPPPPRESPY
jgi:hypothetical protein